MGNVIKPRISKSLHQLRLPAFVENFGPQAALAANDGWPYDRRKEISGESSVCSINPGCRARKRTTASTGRG